jgi:transketolase
MPLDVLRHRLYEPLAEVCVSELVHVPALHHVSLSSLFTPCRFAVVLGDGEMQEGQVYEALMTMRTRNICNLTVIVDVNKFQSDNLTHEIKLLPDFPQLFASFGFSVIEINGNDTSLVADAWCRSAGQLSVIIAHTTKAAGTHLMATEVNCAGKSCQPWHTRVPTWAVYRDFLNEQLASASSALKHLLDAHLLANLSSEHLLSLSNELRPKVAQVGTGKAFGEAIVRKLDEMPNLALLDGDLASSLGVTGASAHPRFFQMGVSEQDMCSFASGLAMSGLLPVVHTYSNFFKRSFENMFIANVDRLKIIYAGSYSGLCYHTDGPSHTSINDTSVMTGLGLVVLDPITPFHTIRLLEWSLSPSVSSSVFFRLRRTPLPEVSVFDEHVQQRDDTFSPARPIMINRSDCGTCRTCFIVMGTVGLFLALECVKMSEAFSKASISVVSALNVPLSDSDLESWKSLLSSFSTFICIEDDAGALYRHVCHMCVQHVASSPPKVLSKRIERPGPSCRTFGACLEHHGFTVAGIEALCV